MTTQDISKMAFRFVFVFGIVNLFAEMTYEGARTIADLAGAEEVDSTHLSEAIQYRMLDRQVWG
jgi:predicted ATPase with chaperone activity